MARIANNDGHGATPVTAAQPSLADTAARLLAAAASARGDGADLVLLVQGERHSFPAADIAALAQQALARPGTDPGDPLDEVTPNEAAALLGMSRPTVMRLVAQGLLPGRMVGSHHRLSRAGVLAYRDSQSVERRQALTTLARITEEYDL